MGKGDLLCLSLVHCAGGGAGAGCDLRRSGGRAGCRGIRLSAVRGRGVLIPVTRLQHLAVLGVDGVGVGMIARGELHLVADHAGDLAERCGRNVRVHRFDVGSVQCRRLCLLHADLRRLVRRRRITASGQRRRKQECCSGQKPFLFHGVFLQS